MALRAEPVGASERTELVIPEAAKASPLVEKLCGKGKAYPLGAMLVVLDADALRHALNHTNDGTLTALERMTLRGLAAISEERKP